jgi:hypothetical protein
MLYKKLFFPGLIILYILILSINLLGLPLYLDEGIYISWASLFNQDASYAYVSMQDGKTPLFIWLTAILNQPFNNLLYTGRLISVVSSAITLICFLLIGLKIIGKKNLTILFLIFLVTPFNVLISRLAFADSLLCAFGSLSLLALFYLKESAVKGSIAKSLILALICGFFLGLSFMAKTTARIFLIAELIIAVFFLAEYLLQKKYKAAALIAVSAALFSGVYFELTGYMRVGAHRFWGQITEKEADLTFSVGQIFNKIFIEGNFFPYFRNLPVAADYFLYYFSTLIVLFAAGAFWLIKTKKHRWLLFLVIFFAVGIFLSARNVASRYFILLVPEFLLVCAVGFGWLLKNQHRAVRIIPPLMLIIPAFISFNMVFYPLNAYYAPDDNSYLLTSDLTALGARESALYLKEKRDSSIVGVTGIWGVSDGAQIIFSENGIETQKIENPIEVVESGKDPCPDNFSPANGKCYKINLGDLPKSPKDKYLYLITDKIDFETFKSIENAEIIKEFTRPETGFKIYLLKLLPDN